MTRGWEDPVGAGDHGQNVGRESTEGEFEIVHYRDAIEVAERTSVIARLEADDLKTTIRTFSRDMVLASALGVLAIAICGAVIALYRHSQNGIPAITILGCTLGLLSGLGQLIYIAYQFVFGALRDTKASVTLVADLASTAEDYRESIYEVWGAVDKRMSDDPSSRRGD